MIDEKYKNSLAQFEGKRGKIQYWLGLLSPGALILLCGLNLWMASRFGNITDYINVWLDEIDIHREYSYRGTFLIGMHKFNTALLYFAFAIVLLPFSIGVSFAKKRNQVIINVLKKHGEI